MADDIYINTGSEFQQPYQGQVIAQGQQPVSRQKAVPTIANSQTPFTNAEQSPFTYQNTVSAQEPNIRNAQQPFTYQRTGRSPFIYQHPSTYPTQTTIIVNAQENNAKNKQQPYPYIATGQEPNIRNSQTPFTTPAFNQTPFTFPANGQLAIPNSNLQEPNIRNIQEPNIVNAQEPNIRSIQEPNQRSKQSPFTYDHRSPYTYNHRSPYTYDHRSPFPYIAQQPSPVNIQTPSIVQQPYQHRSPYTYQTNPAYIPFGGWTGPGYGGGELVEESYVMANQEPNIRTRNVPSRAPSTAQGGYVSSQYQQATQVQTPYTYQYTGPVIAIRQVQMGPDREPLPYQHQVQGQPTQAANPSVSQTNTPVIVFQPFTNQVSAQGQEPNIRNIQEPNIRNIQEPNIRDSRQPVIYDHRSPFTYDHRSPSTYQATGRTPDTYQHRSPFTYQRTGQTPFTYNYRSPFTYQRTGQTPDTYAHQSPFTYQRTGQTPVPRWDGVLQQQWPATPITS